MERKLVKVSGWFAKPIALARVSVAGTVRSASMSSQLSQLKERLDKERNELSTRLAAIDKILPLHEELTSLVNKDYVAPKVEETTDWTTKEGTLEKKTRLVTDPDFDGEYLNPERALTIIIELAQLEREARGLGRIHITTFAEAAKIRAELDEKFPENSSPLAANA